MTEFFKAFVSTLAFLTTTTSSYALSICSMSDQQANQSPQCVRYYFVCRMQPAPDAPSTAEDER